MSDLGLRTFDPPDSRSVKLTLPKSVWHRVATAAQGAGLTVAQAVEQIAVDMTGRGLRPVDPYRLEVLELSLPASVWNLLTESAAGGANDDERTMRLAAAVAQTVIDRCADVAPPVTKRRTGRANAKTRRTPTADTKRALRAV